MNIFRVGVATNYNITKPNLNYKTKDVNSINALFWFAFLSVSLLSLLFRGSPHVTSCGRVISQTNVNRW